MVDSWWICLVASFWILETSLPIILAMSFFMSVSICLWRVVALSGGCIVVWMEVVVVLVVPL